MCVATMRLEQPNLGTWLTHASEDIQVEIWTNTPERNHGVVGSYQLLYEPFSNVEVTDEVLMYLHDDVVCREKDWDRRVLKEFEDAQVGITGFGGALRHGTEDLYKRPYHLPNLRREGYRSNVDDAEVHGERYEGACDVAVVDGFAIAVRRSLLDRVGGWAMVAKGCDFFCYDYAICALARRYGYRIRLVGVRCHHSGGGTSVGLKTKDITSQEAYDKAHRWFYEEFRDVMPWDVRCK